MLDMHSFSENTHVADEVKSIGNEMLNESGPKANTLQNAIFNSSNFSCMATDAKGTIQIFNVGSERMLGYTAAEVLNKLTPTELIDPQVVIDRSIALSRERQTEIYPDFEALVFKAASGIEDIYDVTYIRKDGSLLPAVVSVTALRDAGDFIIGYLLVSSDNCAHKHIEKEWPTLAHKLNDKNVELTSAIRIAEKANLAKSNFLSSMSHELRTPLNAILGFAQLIESGSPAPTPLQQQSLDQVLKGGWYLLDLINEILDLALIESGKLKLQLTPVSLMEVMRECEDLIGPQKQKNNISVVFHEFENHEMVLGERTRLKQVLINLLTNAIKYNKLHGTVTVACTHSKDNLIRISIQDTGAGLSEDQLTQLFQPFNRLGQEQSGIEGTGIGLVVCKHLTELMGGVIGVTSTVGQGSVFWIELHAAQESQKNNSNSEPSATSKGNLQVNVQFSAPVHSLLYIEDNPANLMLVAQLMNRRQDIHFLSAIDAIDGIEIARDQRPDVILMDINLPGMSGIEALKVLSEDVATAHIPVIAISANAVPLDIERGLQLGFVTYLTKPIKINNFMEKLDAAFKLTTTLKLQA